VAALRTRELTELTVRGYELGRSGALMSLAKLSSLRAIRITGENEGKPTFEDLVDGNLLTNVVSIVMKGPLYTFLAQNRSIYDKVVFPGWVDYPNDDCV
jgi:hypothetical protein